MQKAEIDYMPLRCSYEKNGHSNDAVCVLYLSHFTEFIAIEHPAVIKDTSGLDIYGCKILSQNGRISRHG
jgi:hypothetical protein